MRQARRSCVHHACHRVAAAGPGRPHLGRRHLLPWVSYNHHLQHSTLHYQSQASFMHHVHNTCKDVAAHIHCSCLLITTWSASPKDRVVAHLHLTDYFLASTRYRVLSVRPSTQVQMNLITSLVEKYHLEEWTHSRTLGVPLDVLVPPKWYSTLVTTLNRHRVPATLKISDVQA